MMIGGVIVKALAFTGGNYLFFFGRSDEAEKERKRHDLAIEAIQRAESEYPHKRRLRLDYLNQQLRAEQHSLQAFEDVDGGARILARNGRHFSISYTARSHMHILPRLPFSYPIRVLRARRRSRD